ncbi:hypothetical protein TRIP_B330406 [uncultured Desulfatiglans sp.]|uniref:Uncharacterized protein n=1 Tax=Uncultured Desulfatiglans sp. TaxID=1748965 RepID=A0A653A862_UNCDX|nr:hypothetical protein TRIP_B330406 [uncultured Desulfatiglans sp.]
MVRFSGCATRQRIEERPRRRAAMIRLNPQTIGHGPDDDSRTSGGWIMPTAWIERASVSVEKP